MTSPILAYAHGGPKPGRLWSLWEMLQLDAEAFYRAAVALNTFHQLVQADVRKRGEDERDNDDRFHEDDVIPEEFAGALGGHAKGLLRELITMQAEVSVIAVARLIDQLQEGKCTFRNAEKEIWDVNTRLRDELSLKVVFCIAGDKRAFFDAGQPAFGSLVADKLPMAIPDMEDAGKCLALMQGTASVFHSMRVMEAALKGLAMLLGIPYAPSWESYIRQIEDKVTAKHKTKSGKWKRDEPFYKEILGNLQTIKIAWRNPTMHIVRRYSVDEAEQIYVAVRGFVQRVAPRLPKPKAVKTSSSGERP